MPPLLALCVQIVSALVVTALYLAVVAYREERKFLLDTLAELDAKLDALEKAQDELKFVAMSQACQLAAIRPDLFSVPESVAELFHDAGAGRTTWPPKPN